MPDGGPVRRMNLRVTLDNVRALLDMPIAPIEEEVWDTSLDALDAVHNSLGQADHNHSYFTRPKLVGKPEGVCACGCGIEITTADASPDFKFAECQNLWLMSIGQPEPVRWREDQRVRVLVRIDGLYWDRWTAFGRAIDDEEARQMAVGWLHHEAESRGVDSIYLAHVDEDGNPTITVERAQEVLRDVLTARRARSARHSG